MAFVKVGSLKDVQPGWVLEAHVDGHPYAVFRDDREEGELYCLDGECPCTGGPLGQGAVREGMLVCPWHGWRYDCKTGVCAYDDSIKIDRFPVKTEGDDVLIDVATPLNT
jgi:nitrite reductase/ring-hydroxylating ferredoxin subunit